jgi:hypothetical protein
MSLLRERLRAILLIGSLILVYRGFFLRQQEFASKQFQKSSRFQLTTRTQTRLTSTKFRLLRRLEVAAKASCPPASSSAYALSL